MVVVWDRVCYGGTSEAVDEPLSMGPASVLFGYSMIPAESLLEPKLRQNHAVGNLPDLVDCNSAAAAADCPSRNFERPAAMTSLSIFCDCVFCSPEPVTAE